MNKLGLMVLLMAASGCELLMPGNKDMDTNMPADAAVVTGPDFALEPNSMEIQWSLWDSMKSSRRIACDDPMAGVTMLTFSATEQASMMNRKTTVPCPPGLMFGNATISLSNSTGFFDLSATTEGQVQTQTSVIKDVSRMDVVNVNIYLYGHDMN